MQGHAAHPGECDAEQARHDLDLLELLLKHRTGTAEGAALHLKITSHPDKMKVISLWRGEQPPLNLLALPPVAMAGTPHPTHQDAISLAPSPLLFLPSVHYTAAE